MRVSNLSRLLLNLYHLCQKNFFSVDPTQIAGSFIMGLFLFQLHFLVEAVVTTMCCIQFVDSESFAVCMHHTENKGEKVKAVATL